MVWVFVMGEIYKIFGSVGLFLVGRVVVWEDVIFIFSFGFGVFGVGFGLLDYLFELGGVVELFIYFFCY